MKKDSDSDVFMWVFTIFKNIYFVNVLLKQHVLKYAHVFFGINMLEEQDDIHREFQLTRYSLGHYTNRYFKFFLLLFI